MDQNLRGADSGQMKILLAIDDSKFSQGAVRSVASRPWPPDTEIRVLHVEGMEPIASQVETAVLATIKEATSGGSGRPNNESRDEEASSRMAEEGFPNALMLSYRRDEAARLL